MVSTPRRTVVFYCQHSVGLGHLVRSLALVSALADHFEVILLNGGRMPPSVEIPRGVELVNLPPLGQPAHDLVSLDPDRTVEDALAERRSTMVRIVEERRPAVVVIELFPFGRKKFSAELIPFLEAIHDAGVQRPLVLSSVRDLLVGDRPDQAEHDERAGGLCNRFFDGVLVHSDPTFARLDETFRPATPLAIPVYYTGFVTGQATVPSDDPLPRVLVSAGGGMVGEGLLRAAVDAHRSHPSDAAPQTTIVAGPFAPEPVWEWLSREAETTVGLEVVRHVSDLAREMRRSAVSVSQCGYNTAMDILRVRTPAVVVPYAERRDTEQTDRAERLRDLGVVSVVPHEELGGASLAGAIAAAIGRGRRDTVRLDTAGATASADLLMRLVTERRG